MMTRREALHRTGMAATVIAATSALDLSAQTPAPPPGPFTLPKLGYAYDALEPHIDARTMEIHHTKHHRSYIENANKALADYPDLQNLSGEQLLKNLNNVPEKIRIAVRNNVGGHLNHAFFWQTLAP